MPHRFNIVFQRLAVVLAAALLLWAQSRAALLLLQTDWIGITFPYPLDYGEGPLLDQAMRLVRFENIYRHDLTVPPYTLANYPPLFPLAQAPFVWAFGPAFWYGRALSVLSILAAALPPRCPSADPASARPQTARPSSAQAPASRHD